MRRALVPCQASPVLHQPRFEEAADDAQQALVADAPGQARHHHVVVDPVEEFLQIEVDDDGAPLGNVLPGFGAARRERRAPGESRSSRPRMSDRGSAAGLAGSLVAPGGPARSGCPTGAPRLRGLGISDPAHRLGPVAAIEQRSHQRVLVVGEPRQQVVDGHAIDAWRAVVRLHPFPGLVQVRGTRDPFHEVLRQGSLPVRRRKRLWLRLRPSSGSAVAGCAVAQSLLQGLVEEVHLVGPALPPLHAHRVISDCSLHRWLRPFIAHPARLLWPLLTSPPPSLAVAGPLLGHAQERWRSPRVRR